MGKGAQKIANVSRALVLYICSINHEYLVSFTQVRTSARWGDREHKHSRLQHTVIITYNVTDANYTLDWNMLLDYLLLPLDCFHFSLYSSSIFFALVNQYKNKLNNIMDTYTLLYLLQGNNKFCSRNKLRYINTFCERWNNIWVV